MEILWWGWVIRQLVCLHKIKFSHIDSFYRKATSVCNLWTVGLSAWGSKADCPDHSHPSFSEHVLSNYGALEAEIGTGDTCVLKTLACYSSQSMRGQTLGMMMVNFLRGSLSPHPTASIRFQKRPSPFPLQTSHQGLERGPGAWEGSIHQLSSRDGQSEVLLYSLSQGFPPLGQPSLCTCCLSLPQDVLNICAKCVHALAPPQEYRSFRAHVQAFLKLIPHTISFWKK